MRLNFKWIVVIGLLLGIGEFWWSRQSSEDEDWGLPVVSPAETAVSARAREITAPAGKTTVTTAASWQTKMGATLASNASSAEQADSLLAMFPQLPPAGQYDVAHHISNLLPDDACAAWAAYLTNATISVEARNVIYADLLHRPNSIKFPLLLELARTPSAAHSASAARLLRATLQADHGQDWNAWQASLQTWLSRNPDPGIPGMDIGN